MLRQAQHEDILTLSMSKGEAAQRSKPSMKILRASLFDEARFQDRPMKGSRSAKR